MNQNTLYIFLESAAGEQNHLSFFCLRAQHAQGGGGAVAVKDVPPNCTVVGIPGRIVKRDGKRVTSEQSAAAKRMENLPDIVEEQHRSNCARIDYLEAQIAALRDEVCPQFKKALADVDPVNPEDLEEG